MKKWILASAEIFKSGGIPIVGGGGPQISSLVEDLMGRLSAMVSKLGYLNNCCFPRQIQNLQDFSAKLKAGKLRNPHSSKLARLG